MFFFRLKICTASDALQTLSSLTVVILNLHQVKLDCLFLVISNRFSVFHQNIIEYYWSKHHILLFLLQKKKYYKVLYRLRQTQPRNAGLNFRSSLWQRISKNVLKSKSPIQSVLVSIDPPPSPLECDVLFGLPLMFISITLKSDLFSFQDKSQIVTGPMTVSTASISIVKFQFPHLNDYLLGLLHFIECMYNFEGTIVQNGNKLWYKLLFK